MQSPQVTTEPSSSLLTSVTRSADSLSHDGAIFLPSHIHHEVQSHQVTTEPSSSLRTSVTKYRVTKSPTEPSSSLRKSVMKCRVPKSRRSHIPPFAHPSRSAESPSHDKAIFLSSHIHHEVQMPPSHDGAISLPSHIRHEVQSHQVTTEPSTSLRTSVTKCRFPQVTTEPSFVASHTHHEVPSPKSRRSHLPGFLFFY